MRANEIIVLKAGQINERGTHESFLNKKVGIMIRGINKNLIEWEV